MEHIGGTSGFSGSGDTEVSPDGPAAIPPDPEDSHAVDEQLTAILEAIRSWDWRAGIFADDGTLNAETEPAGRHISKLEPDPDPLSFGGLFLEPSVDAIESYHSRRAEMFSASDPRPRIDDPLEASWMPSGDGADRPTYNLIATKDPFTPENAPPTPPVSTSIVDASVPPPQVAAPVHSPVDTSPDRVGTPPAEISADWPTVVPPVTVDGDTPVLAAPPANHVPEPTVETTERENHVLEPSTDRAEPDNNVPPLLVERAEPTVDVAVPPTAGIGATALGPTASPREPGPSRRRSPQVTTPGRWWVKYVWLGAAVIVVIIVAIIRSNSPSSTSGPPAALNPAPSGSAATNPTIQLSRTVLTEFASISKTLDTANITVTKELANGSSQSVAQVATEIAPYLTALDTFNFDLHLMTWPTAMQVASQDLVLRTKSLASFLGTELSANSVSLNSWFTQFHALAHQTQLADNVVRRDIGLPITTNYP